MPPHRGLAGFQHPRGTQQAALVQGSKEGSGEAPVEWVWHERLCKDIQICITGVNIYAIVVQINFFHNASTNQP
jgi:hypothetical protein